LAKKVRKKVGRGVGGAGGRPYIIFMKEMLALMDVPAAPFLQRLRDNANLNRIKIATEAAYWCERSIAEIDSKPVPTCPQKWEAVVTTRARTQQELMLWREKAMAALADLSEDAFTRI
jgi:hypothetical protein